MNKLTRISSRWSVLSDTNLSIKQSNQKQDMKKQPLTSLKAAQKSWNNSSSLSNTTLFSKNFNYGSTTGRSLNFDSQQISKVNKPQLTWKRHSKPATTSIFLKNTPDEQYPPITQIYITHQMPSEWSPRVLFNTHQVYHKWKNTANSEENLEKYLNSLV